MNTMKKSKIAVSSKPKLTLRVPTQTIISAPNAQFQNFGNFPNHREVPVTEILELIFTVKSQHFVITNLYTLFSKYKSIIVCTFLWLSLDFQPQIPAKTANSAHAHTWH